LTSNLPEVLIPASKAEYKRYRSLKTKENKARLKQSIVEGILNNKELIPLALGAALGSMSLAYAHQDDPNVGFHAVRGGLEGAIFTHALGKGEVANAFGAAGLVGLGTTAATRGISEAVEGYLPTIPIDYRKWGEAQGKGVLNP
tara:strand:+ start:45 stop:476 length:432 start_codon:yes stop_codon:yes gene_type:complete